MAEHVHTLCWLADPTNVDPCDELLQPATRGPLVARTAAELSRRLVGLAPLASVSTLHVIYLGFSLEAQASAVEPGVGARLGQLVSAEIDRRTRAGHVFDTMPTPDLVEFLAVADTWPRSTRRTAYRRRLGAVLDRRLGLA